MRVGYYEELPVMMAVRWRRSGEAAVTSSAVDLEPKPLSPREPRRYLKVSSIFFFVGVLFFVFVWLCPSSVPRNKDFVLVGKKKVEKGRRDWNRLSGVRRFGILMVGGGRTWHGEGRL